MSLLASGFYEAAAARSTIMDLPRVSSLYDYFTDIEWATALGRHVVVLAGREPTDRERGQLSQDRWHLLRDLGDDVTLQDEL